MKKILLSAAVVALSCSGFAQSKLGNMIKKGADAAKKELATPAEGSGSGTGAATGGGAAATTGQKSGTSSATVGGGTSSGTPGSWSGPRPMNPTITNKKSRLYTAADGQYMYTAFEAPSSDLHKNNLDKILFGKARINKDGTTAQISNTFHSGENIYGRAFMRSCMMNFKTYMTDISPEAAKCMDGNFDVNYTIDNKIFGTLMSSSLNGEMENKSTFTIITVGAGEDAEANNEDFIKELNNLPEGSHNVKLVVWATQGDFISVDPVAMGEFTFVKDPGAKAMGLGRNFSSVKEGMDDAALKAKCLAKMNTHAKNQGWKETFTEVKITDEDWSAVRNSLTSVIEGRVISIAAKAKWPDGHCTYQDFSMYSGYDGSNYSNAISVYGVGSQTEIDCQ
jgi:hypothetical protein